MSTIIFTDAYRQQRHMAASGEGTEGDPFVKKIEIENGLTPSQVQSAVAAANQSTMLSQGQILEAIEAAIQNANLSTLSNSQVQSAFINALQVSPAGGANQQQIVDAIMSTLNVQFQEWLGNAYQTILATTISASIDDVLKGNFGGDALRDTITRSIEDALQTQLNSSIITQSISDFFQGSGYWGTLAETELTLRKEKIGRVVMYSVSATDTQISIPSDHPWYGQQVELLSWFHNSSATTDAVISIVVSSHLDPQETFAIQINDQSGSFPPGFIVQDSFLIRRLTAGSTFSMILTGRIADTIEDLFIG